MSFGELIPIVGIVMGCGIPIMAIRSKTKLRIAQLQAGAIASESAERAALNSSRVNELEDRVRVLERIVTDRGYDLATQIEALRDQRRTEDEGAGVPLGLNARERA